MAPSGECLRMRARHGVLAGNTVRSMPERFEIYIVYKWRYINTSCIFSFHYFVMSVVYYLRYRDAASVMATSSFYIRQCFSLFIAGTGPPTHS